MALVVYDRVQETTTTSGTGTITLAGAVSGYRTFSVIGNANTTFYTIIDGTAWEVGIGTYTTVGTTLSRDTVLASSTGAKLTLSAGTKQVWCDYPAGKAVFLDASNNVVPLGTIASATWNATTIGLAYGGTGATSAPAAQANFMGFTSTATAAGTTTLTNTSTVYQLFTGTTTQTVVLPVTTTLVQGWTFHIENASTGNLTVNSSGGNLVITVLPNTTAMISCILNSGTTAASWEAGLTDFSAASSTVSGYLTSTDWSTFNGKQAALVSGTNIKTVNGTTLLGSGDLGTIGIAYGGTGKTTATEGLAALKSYATTATAAGSTTLTVSSAYQQFFTGTTTQTIVLPVTSTLTLGWSVDIINNSTGNLTVNSSGANLVGTVLPGTSVNVACVLTSGTTAASWDFDYNGFASVTGTGSAVLSASPTFTGTPTAPHFSASNGIYINNLTIATTYSIPSGYSGSSAGPITINSGVTVTVPSGSKWVVL
jgi:hypothetical protein